MQYFTVRQHIVPGDWITSGQLGPEAEGFCVLAREEFFVGDQVAYVNKNFELIGREVPE